MTSPTHKQKLLMTDIARKWMKSDNVQPEFCWGEFYDCMHEYASLSADLIYQVMEPTEGTWTDCEKRTYDTTDGAFKRVVRLAKESGNDS